MNTLLQNSLVIIAVAIAVLFLIKKFFIKKSKPKSNCGDDCGCH